MEKTFNIDIKGYYKDETRVLFPQRAGIYFVYRGVLNTASQPHSAILNELVYVGETDNLHNRHNEHDRRQDFFNTLKYGEQLFYCYAETSFSEEDRKRVEAALIHELQPSLNIQNQTLFNYDKTIVNVLGDRHAFIPQQVTVPSYQ